MDNGDIFLWELLGTATLILLGTAVVANTVLKKSLGHNGGWLLVNFGWGLAVFAGASIAAPSGAHLNPAVTVGLATADKLDWDKAPVYFAGQMVGAIIGAILTYLAYKKQFDTHDDPANTLGIFSTGPTVPSPIWNTVTELIGTFVLVFWILLNPEANIALGYAAVAFIVLGIGNSLGGPTGYAINPARDLGPRIVYAILPIKGKGDANWAYSWVPIVGPILGAFAAGGLFNAVKDAIPS